MKSEKKVADGVDRITTMTEITESRLLPYSYRVLTVHSEKLNEILIKK